MFGGPEVSYHQTYSARGWLSILRTPYPTQNLQRKHRTDTIERPKKRWREQLLLWRRNGSKGPILDVYDDDDDDEILRARNFCFRCNDQL